MTQGSRKAKEGRRGGGEEREKKESQATGDKEKSGIDTFASLQRRGRVISVVLTDRE